MQTLNFLGIGSSFNSKEKNNSAFIKVKNTFILIDCGEDIFKRIIKFDLLKDIKYIHVLITHPHSDHIGSLSSLIFYCYYVLHIMVYIYYPYSLDSILTGMGNRIREEYIPIKIKDNYPFNIYINDGFDDTISIVPIKVNHVEYMQCYGYIINTNSCNNINKTIIWYSGDCNEISKEAMSFNPTEIYQDTCILDYKDNPHCYHENLFYYFNGNKKSNVYCMHIDDNKLKRIVKKEGFKIPLLYTNNKIIKFVRRII